MPLISLIRSPGAAPCERPNADCRGPRFREERRSSVFGSKWLLPKLAGAGVLVASPGASARSSRTPVALALAVVFACLCLLTTVGAYRTVGDLPDFGGSAEVVWSPPTIPYSLNGTLPSGISLAVLVQGLLQGKSEEKSATDHPLFAPRIPT
jgi:hypothetical protein